MSCFSCIPGRRHWNRDARSAGLALIVITFSLAGPVACHRQLDLEAGAGYPPISTAQLVAPKIGNSPDRYWSRSRKYMIATDAPEASRAGVEMYGAGGNAIDAAVAVSFAISVVRPQSTGLGGGGFLLVHLARANRTVAYDFRERAPAAAFRRMYLDQVGAVRKDASLKGPQAVGVPGTIAGLVEIHRQHGRLPLARVIAPAIRLAREGFTVYPDLRQAIERAEPDMDGAMRAVFVPDGQVPEVGAVLVQSDLADTLELIADQGERPLYSANGALARDLVAYMESQGGPITAADLSAYRVYSSEPLRGSYRGHEIAIMPPPSSGVFILEMLAMLETRDLRALYAQGGPAQAGRPALYEHFLAEVFRRGYADRSALGGDPRFFPVPTEFLTSADYARRRVADIDLTRASASGDLSVPDPSRPDVPAGALSGRTRRPESTETTHFSILDAEGNAVASTQSVNYLFGARVMLPGRGIVLNDTMDDFSVAPGQPNVYGLVGGEVNAIEPGKTPLSSMSPAIVFEREPGPDGRRKPRLVVGSPGGSRIITAILHTIINDIDFGLHPYASVARGRVHHQYLPDILYYADSPAGRGRVTELQAFGHQVKDSAWQAKVFLVRADAQGLVGVSDPRGDGRPLGEPDPKN